MKKYKLAALGGTFDRFHQGHATLLHYAFSVAEKSIIGITRNGMNANKLFAYNIQSYEQRLKSVNQFLHTNNYLSRVTLVELHNTYGPTLEKNAVDCLIVSPLTKIGAEEINQKRQEKNLTVLPIEVCELKKSNDGDHISSTRIRQGSIDRTGFVYEQLFDKTIILTDGQKDLLKQPIGILLQKNILNILQNYLDPKQTNITVGDASSVFAFQNKLPINNYIFDSREQRQILDTSLEQLLNSEEIIRCQNLPGTISTELVHCLRGTLAKGQHIQIDGEEDLAVLPAILFLPLKSTILYGQPNQGMVVVKVTEKLKTWCKDFLSRK